MVKTTAAGTAAKTHQDDALLTFAEVARRFGRHRSTISRWVREGRLKPIKTPTRPMLRQSEIDKYLGVH